MKQAFSSLPRAEIERNYKLLTGQYESILENKININMARGKPSSAQLDLSDPLLNLDRETLGIYSSDGSDCRNYGDLAGIPECRALFADLLGVSADNIIVGGGSSLNLMYDYFAQCCTHGVGGNLPWLRQPGCKYIALVPGYDRHFAIAEHFGIEMLSVKMTPSGPDMDEIERLVRDPLVKGIFCVPKYSNPDGVTYSASCMERLAALQPAAPDFRVIWDEAYVIHDLYDEGDSLLNIFELSAKYGTEDHFIAFASTSKITFSGGGISAIAASDANIREILERMTVQIICHDKINQLRHTHFFKTADDLKQQMKKHAAILRPKFEAVLTVFHEELDGLEIASFTSPRGGYFISFDVEIGSAKRVGELCQEAGLILTSVGSTYPYGVDPSDSNIRIAPSCPAVDELQTASRLLCLCVKMAACEALLKKESRV